VTTLVVPLDGSLLAEAALRPAVAFAARAVDGRVLAVTCSPDDGDEALAYLEDRSRRFRGVVPVEVRFVTSDSAGDGIADTVATTPGSVVCMATHGHGGVRAAVLGSVAEQVVRRADAPVVLVGPHCRTSLLVGEESHLVVCTDGSAFAEAVVDDAIAWANELDLAPWFVEVVAPDENVAPPEATPRNREVEAATAHLERLARRAGNATTDTEVLHGADVCRSIVTFAERLSAGLVAMATHGRTGLARTVLGSVSTDVVRHAPCPVLLVRPREPSSGA
jgi:nucleotide-binding universal stress UspA family protein